MKIVERITLEEIQAAITADPNAQIFFSTKSRWWTHDPAHLFISQGDSSQSVLRRAMALRRAAGDLTAPLDNFTDAARKSLGIPCDPNGAPLFQTGGVALLNIESHRYATPSELALHWIDQSCRALLDLGRHGVNALVAAHHLNCIVSDEDPRPACAADWNAYNDALDRLNAAAARSEKPNV